MNQELIWQDIDKSAYAEEEKKIRRLPLLQSVDYNEAAVQFYGYTPRYISLQRNDQTIGLCIIQNWRALGGLLKATMLDRGPVWFEGYNTSENFEHFIHAFTKRYRRRIAHNRRIIPEHLGAHDIMQTHKFEKTADGYQTIWIDLTKDEQSLRAALKKNWRGSLQKAEKSDLTLDWDETGKTLPFMLKTYEIDKKRRNYPGPSVPFMKALCQKFQNTGTMLIGRAMLGKDCIASITILCHGTSATYQIGWTGAQGRENAAHHLLLWNALIVLKNKGYKDFDLGGMNDKDAKTIAKFKMAMGGDAVQLSGLYR